MTLRNWLQFAFIVTIWGTTWFVIKTQLGDVPPGWSITYRFAAGGAALLAWCWWRGLPVKVPTHAYWFVGLVGICQFALNFNLVYRSELYLPSGIPAVAFALLMVPNAFFAWLFLKRPVTRRFLAGAALGVTGVGLLFAQQLAYADNSSDTALGLGLIVVALFCVSTANVLQASPKATSFEPLTGLAWSMLSASLLNAVFTWMFVSPPQFDTSPGYWLGFLYLGVVASSVAFAFYYDLIRKMGPAEAAWSGVLIPILAMAITTVLEGFEWTPMAIAGCALALAGTIVALSKPRLKG